MEALPCPDPVYVFRARVARWVDADTVDLVVSLPFRLALGNPDEPARFRLMSVDAAELRTDLGMIAAALVRDLCPAGSRITIRTHMPKGSDSFGRWLAEVWAPDGTYVAKVLVDAGVAEPWT